VHWDLARTPLSKSWFAAQYFAARRWLDSTIEFLRAKLKYVSNNTASISLIVSSTATVVIAIYAVTSYGLQKRLAGLSEFQLSLATEPELEGSIRLFYPFSEEESQYYHRLLNVGGDTAWGVYDDVECFLMLDTLIIEYPGFLGGGILRGPGGAKGDFSTFNPIPPGGVFDQSFVELPTDIKSLQLLLSAIPILKCEIIYWGNSPIKRHDMSEFFLYGTQEKYPYYNNMFARLDNKSSFVEKFRDLINSGKVGRLDHVGRISRPAIYDKIFGLDQDPLGLGPTIVLIGRTPPNQKFGDEWTFQDTLIFVNDSLIDFLEYRRRYPVFLEYEKYMWERKVR
jgi:hypothetical protein